MIMLVLLISFLWTAWPDPAQALPCTGSLQTWSCPNTATNTEIRTAMASATDGYTITFDPGTYTVTSQIKFSNTKGGTLICATTPNTVGAATVNPCIVNSSTPIFGSDTFSGTNIHFYRISGFTFDLQGGGAGGLGALYWDSYNGGSNAATLTNVRVDHNTFRNGSNGAQTTLVGSAGPPAQKMYVWGVYDHNFYTNATQMTMVHSGGTNASPALPAQAGTANNLFMEDNLLSFTTVGNGSAEGCTDAFATGYVVRHNISTNCLWAAHGVQHGGGGPANYEFYDNTAIMDAGSVAAGEADCYRCFHHQGSGEILAFNNTFTAYSGKSTEVISVAHYRSFGGATPTQCDGTSVSPPDGNRTPIGTYRGYPCWHQPGREFLTASLKPMYTWNNRWSDTGAKVDLVIPDFGGTPDYINLHVAVNRDYYNAVSKDAQTSPTSPFNGTTGMGFGTLANRPTTCTPGTDSADFGAGGVGYFAIDQGTQGMLYRCKAINTWTTNAESYQPYVYPHPLVGVVVPPPPPTGPRFAPGINLRRALYDPSLFRFQRDGFVHLVSQ